MPTRFALAFSLLVACVAPAGADMLDYNTSIDPIDAVTDSISAGWFFDLPTKAFLDGVQSRFAATGETGRTLQVAILGGDPTLTFAAPLASGTFASSNTLSGVMFATAPLLDAGRYFVAFSDPAGFTSLPGTSGVGVNYVNPTEAGAVSLGNPLYTLAGDTTPFTHEEVTGQAAFPILQISYTPFAPAPVPEPSTTLLLALCGVVGGGLSWRRRLVKAA